MDEDKLQERRKDQTPGPLTLSPTAHLSPALWSISRREERNDQFPIYQQEHAHTMA